MGTQAQILLTRQPIFDAHQKVVAYELLCQSESMHQLVSAEDDSLSSAAVLDAYTSISDQGEVKRVPAFISLSFALLKQTGLPGLPKKQVILEFSLKGADPKEALRNLLPLINEGYRVSVSGVNDPQAFASLLKLVYLIKVSVDNKTPDEIQALRQELAPWKRPLMATHISDYETLELCVSNKFSLFQGNFLSKPRAIAGQKVKANQVVLIQLLQILGDPKATPEKIEKLILQDPVLTYKLLRIVNSAAYALVREVESVAQAVVLLGLEQVRKWATVISLDAHTGKPEELTRNLLTRAHMCELIAIQQKRQPASSYFMVGMMSGIHLLLDIQQDELLEQLPLADDIKEAISQNSGPLGDVLAQVLSYESGEWDKLPADFDGELYENAYRGGLKLTKDSMQALYDTTDN